MKAAIPFIIIALCVGAYFFYVRPALGQITALMAKRAEYQSILEKVRELKAERDTILTEYNNISEDSLARLNKIIPKKFDPVLFANDLNGMASRYGMFVKDLKSSIVDANTIDAAVAEPTANESYKTMSVIFKVSGQFEQFIKFLKDLESNLELVDVVDLSIRQAGLDKTTENLEDYVVGVKTYSLE